MNRPVIGILGSAVLGAAVLASGLKAAEIRPIVNPPIRDESLSVHESSATASLMGQARTSMTSWLWLRADLYLHNGVEMRPLTEGEQRQGVTVEGPSHDGNEQLREESEITTIPPRERDFRGIFGDVERQVASFKDMHGHVHNDPSQAMPLFRLMTWLDPSFLPGWTMGGMILARDRNEQGTARSIRYLQEGWRANPGSVELPSQIGYTIASRHGKLEDAVWYLEQAREAGFPRRHHLTEEERESLRTTYRWLALCYRDLGQTLREQAALREGISIFKDDPLMPRLLVKARG